MSEYASGSAITVDDLQRKALHVRDLAQKEAQAVVHEQGARIVAVVAVGVLVAVSVAYYLGSRHRS